MERMGFSQEKQAEDSCPLLLLGEPRTTGWVFIRRRLRLSVRSSSRGFTGEEVRFYGKNVLSETKFWW